VALTKTEKRSTRDHKATFIEQIRQEIDQHDTLYLFHYDNMRSHHFQKVRLFFRPSSSNTKESRLFLGKNKLIQIAFGRTIEDEYDKNLRYVSKRMVGGSVGLLTTSRPIEEVETYLTNFCEPDYARAGTIATRDVMITSEMISYLPVNMMEQLRKLGLPIEIKNGTIVFRETNRTEYTICHVGKALSAEQCKLLVHFDMKLSNFQVKLLCRWEKKDGTFHSYE
jgi:mRNA turnover protein 4